MGISYGYPHFCLGMPSFLDFIWFGTVASVDISTCLVKWEYEATLQLATGFLFDWVGVYHIKVDNSLSLNKFDMEGYLPIPYPLWSCCHDSVLWVVMVVIQSAVWCIYRLRMSIPSTKHMWFCRHPLPLHITWGLHPSLVGALADVHWRSCNFPLIQPREVLLAWH